MRFVFLIIVLFACSSPQKEFAVDLTSKESALTSFINSLKSGEIELVQKTMTVAGYASLKIWVPDGEETIAFEYMGKDLETRSFSWKPNSTVDVAFSNYYAEDAIQLYFKQDSGIWKVNKILME
ncbi:MAG: hypothetical protein MRY83_01020 [Flavobacteriales bacterium]|nr:hypothetical protein [Flavobacteriales bacterium]